MTTVNQKEYLKKYLSLGSKPGKKKKHKKKSIASDRIKIIDDDIDIVAFNKAVEEDLHGANEDAPQIVGVIDERPLELRIDDYRKSDLWKPLGLENDNAEVSNSTLNLAQNESSTQTTKLLEKNRNETKLTASNFNYNYSPHRNKSSNDYDKVAKDKYSKNIENGSIKKNNDISSIRRNKNDDTHQFKRSTQKNDNLNRENEKHNDVSPTRKIKIDDLNLKDKELSPIDGSVKFHTRNDLCPPRKCKKDDDISPVRETKMNNDASPPRRSRRNSEIKRIEMDNDISPPRNRRGSDTSPVRKSKHENNMWEKKKYSEKNSQNKHIEGMKSRDKMYREKYEYKKYPKHYDKYRSSRRDDKKYNTNNRLDKRSRRDSDESLLRERRDDNVSTKSGTSSNTFRKSRWDKESEKEPSLESDKPFKTLDGKKSGLRRANEIIQENQFFKEKEDEYFKTIAEISGKDVAPIVRDRKTGKIRDFKKEEEEIKKNQEKEDETKAKYDRWGKGLKQLEEANEKLNNDLHEMSKPLARYADDEDLERHLKEMEREGDPMLEYLRKKRRRTEIESGKPLKPQFEGEFMPNRYGIRPGHRWDGVDRSNGYEKKWFEVMNSRRAQQEDAYKWSTEDM